MAVSPSTDLTLLKLPIELDDENQLTFASASAQAAYFQSLTKLSEDNFTYQRRDNAIRFPAHIDSIIEYNYVMYKNSNYSNKWFYARIVNMEYVNDNMTLIIIEEDAFQTWQFDLVYNQCFVEREHVNDDTFGKHTLPEGLETGEYIRGLTGAEYSYNGEFWLVFQVTELISNMDDAVAGSGRIYNGVYSGLHAVLIDNYATADALVSAYDDAGKSDAIIACFYIPKALVTNVITNGGVTLHGHTYTVYFPYPSSSINAMGSLTVARPTTIDGYTPKNNKLFTREYCFLLASNNAGTEAQYGFEDFLTSGAPSSSASFSISGALSQGGSIRMIPGNDYKHPDGTVAYSNHSAVSKYGITAGKLPICSWNSDYYTNWLTQNAVNNSAAIFGGIASATTKLAYGDIVGAEMSVINSIASNVSRHYEASITPDQAKGNTNCGDFNFSDNVHLTVTTMTVRKEYAQVIDGFFSAYGYKVNAWKIPNITGRTYWNYVKTVGSSVHGYLPQASVDKINSMFDKGITFWHDATKFMDYTQNNAIITP